MKIINRITMICLFVITFSFATDVVVKSDGTGSNNNGISFQNSSSTELLVIEGDGSIQAGAGRISDKTGFLSPVGSLIMYAGSSAPTGWLLCNGAAISRSTYADLYTAIGTAYGAGDGSSTFTLPDLRGRMPLGLDNMGGASANTVTNAQADALNGKAGTETHALSSAEMPTHTIYSSSNMQGIGTTAGQYSLVGSINTTTIGSGTAHNNMPPYLALNYIIKY